MATGRPGGTIWWPEDPLTFLPFTLDSLRPSTQQEGKVTGRHIERPLANNNGKLTG